ncbi:MAG: SH3 domain-containing protein [Chloroflexota bacterium]|nr:SH3 domain-containing protein [Chloroflexota bacterium]
MKIWKRICLILGLLTLLIIIVVGFFSAGLTQAVSAMPAIEDGESQEVTMQVSVPTNCRSGPGKPYDIVTVLHTGTTINVIARHETDDFWLIENPDGCGESCWVWGYYAAITGSKDSLPEEEAPPLPTDVTLNVSVPTNCRVGPGKAYDIACVLHTGKTVNVLGRHETENYWLIEHPDGCETPCWVWGYFATLTGPVACLPAEEIPIIPTEVTLEVSIPTNCRVGPGKTYDILSVLHTGTTVNVLGRHKTGYFWMVENPKGDGTCWVWSYYATLTGQASCLPVEEPPTD